MMEILLEDVVEDIHTGFKGTATSKMEFLNGCIQIEVVPRVGKDNKMIESIFIDIQSLKVVKKGPRHPKPVKKVKSKDDYGYTGGPNHSSVKMRGY